MVGQNLLLIIFVFFGGALVISGAINTFFMRFSKRLGIQQNNHLETRWASTSKPSLGGISFFISFLMSFLLYAIIFDAFGFFQNPEWFGMLAVISIAFLLGLIDDAYDIRPLVKLMVQMGCGVLLILTNNQIQLFEWDFINVVFTIFWVVLIMNSINMLDNMDGITTVASICIILTFLGVSLPLESMNQVDFFIMTGVLGALMSFLILNWHPSKMFMGDKGSQFLGIFLAYFSIKYLWNNGLSEGSATVFSNLTMVALTFTVPLMDTFFVVIKRLLRGQSPMVGGKDHTTHTLSYKGLSDGQVAFVFTVLGVLSCSLALFVAKYMPASGLVLAVLWLFPILLLIIAFKMSAGTPTSSEENKKET